MTYRITVDIGRDEHIIETNVVDIVWHQCHLAESYGFGYSVEVV